MTPPDGWLTTRALVAYTGLSRRSLHDQLHRLDDPLPFSRVGRRLLVRRADVEAWLLRRRDRSGREFVERVCRDVGAILGTARDA